VRCDVADNRNTPPTTLTTLAADHDDYTHWRIAHNPNTPTDTIRALATDTNPNVAQPAATSGRLNCLRRYANTLDGEPRDHALLLIDNGFTGWPDDLATLLSNQRIITSSTWCDPELTRHQ